MVSVSCNNADKNEQLNASKDNKPNSLKIFIEPAQKAETSLGELTDFAKLLVIHQKRFNSIIRKHQNNTLKAAEKIIELLPEAKKLSEKKGNLSEQEYEKSIKIAYGMEESVFIELPEITHAAKEMYQKSKEFRKAYEKYHHVIQDD